MATKSSLKARHEETVTGVRKSRATSRRRSSGVKTTGARFEKAQETAQKVVGYAKENPLTAVGAVGAGVVLTTVFWDDISRVARRGMRRFR